MRVRSRTRSSFLKANLFLTRQTGILVSSSFATNQFNTCSMKAHAHKHDRGTHDGPVLGEPSSSLICSDLFTLTPSTHPLGGIPRHPNRTVLLQLRILLDLRRHQKPDLRHKRGWYIWTWSVNELEASQGFGEIGQRPSGR